MNSPAPKYLAAAAFGAVLLAAVWLATRPGGAGPKKDDKGIPEFQEVSATIYDLHKQQKWLNAKDDWEKLSKDGRLSEAQRLEVTTNLQLATDMEKARVNKTWKREKDDTKGKPEVPLTEAEIIAKYPVGRAVRNVAALDIEGKGTNQQWFLKAKGHFAFRITNQALSRVIENTGNKIVLRIKFEEASQLLAISEVDEVKLEWPKGRLAELSIALLDDLMMDVPLYRRVRWAAEKIEQMDPDLKSTLTYFAKQLKDNGVDLAASPNGAELITQIEQLSGKEFEITYIRVLGVTEIKCLNGAVVPQETLAHLAYNSSLLTDAYLSKVLELKEGDVLPVRAEDVAGLIGGGYRATASGVLELQRTVKQDAEDSVQLELKGDAPVILTFEEKNGPVRVSLTPNKTSELTYSKKDGLVTSALLNWNVNLDSIPDSLLLLGTTKIEARCKSHYESKDVTPSGSAPANPAGAQQ